MASSARHPDHPYITSTNGAGHATARHPRPPEAAAPGPMPPGNRDYIDLESAADGNDMARSSRERSSDDAAKEERRQRRKARHQRHRREHEKFQPNRKGFHPGKALMIALKSSCTLAACTNILLPAVPIGLVLHWVRPDWHLRIFTLNYIAMIPMANLLSFSSQELARKLPRVFGMVLETTFGSAVEIILCLLLLFKEQFSVIRAAILGSMLANLLLCTGLCFIVGGIRYKDQEFDELVVETGGGLLLISVVGLMLPCAFYESLTGRLTTEELAHGILQISRITGCLLLIAYALFLLFQLRTHHILFDTLLGESEKKKTEKAGIEHFLKPKLTTWEAFVFVCISLTLVTLHAIFLVQEIHWIVVERHISDAFMGLILVPLVEKAAEHLTAIDEAWDDAMDFALSHLLGSTIQTALMVSPIVVVAGWIADKAFDFNFEVFMVVVLVFAVLVVGNFLKDRKSNYLEGALCIIFYLIIATSTWYYPNPESSEH